MTIKKNYNIGETVWIHGVNPSNKLAKGTVIAAVNLSSQGFEELQYIISIPTHIEPLLEIRTWHTISQDDKGPVGSIRDIGSVTTQDNKKMRQIGYIYSDDSHYDNEEPSPDQVFAALQKSTDGLTHKPLVIKESKPKRKYYPKRKKP